MKEIDFGMNNFDNTVEKGMDSALKLGQGQVYGSHYAWNFYGRVFFKDGQFHEKVMIHGTHRQTISADTLEELMKDVNDIYGAD